MRFSTEHVDALSLPNHVEAIALRAGSYGGTFADRIVLSGDRVLVTVRGEDVQLENVQMDDGHLFGGRDSEFRLTNVVFGKSAGISTEELVLGGVTALGGRVGSTSVSVEANASAVIGDLAAGDLNVGTGALVDVGRLALSDRLTMGLRSKISVQEGGDISAEARLGALRTIEFVDGSSVMHNLELAGGRVVVQDGAALAIEGEFKWAGGNGFIGGASGRVQLNGESSFGLRNTTANFHAVTLLNSGTFSHTGTAGIQMHDGARFVNTVDGVFQASGGGWIYDWQDAGASFDNQGRMEISGNGFGIDAAFSNSGVVDVQAGGLNLKGDGMHSGVLNIARGATLWLQGGRQRFGAGAKLTGEGNLVYSAPSVFESGYEFEGTTTVGGGGSIELTQPKNELHNLELAGGRVVVQDGADLAIEGEFKWAGGNGFTGGASGRVQLNGESSFGLRNTTANFHAVTLLNSGAFSHTGTAGIQMHDGARFVNTVDGVFQASGGGWIYDWQDAGASFDNQGRMEISGNGFGIDAAFSNSGVVDVQAGVLELTNQVSQADGRRLTGGKWIVRDGAGLRFPAGESIVVNDADVTFIGPTSSFTAFESLSENAGQIHFLGERKFVTQGNLSSSGTLVVGVGSGLSISGAYTSAGVTTVDGELVAEEVSIGAGAVLTGGGSVDGRVEVDPGGVIAPGRNAGLLSVKALAFSAGAIYRWEMDATGASDSLTVDEDLILDDEVAIEVVDLGGSPELLDEYILFSYGGANPENIRWRISNGEAPRWDLSNAVVTIDEHSKRVLLSGLTMVRLAGDYNYDGVIDAADYTVWRDALGTTGDGSADGDGDGVIGAGDYVVWKEQFGAVAAKSVVSGESRAVPEPSASVLMCLGLWAAGISTVVERRCACGHLRSCFK